MKKNYTTSQKKLSLKLILTLLFGFIIIGDAFSQTSEIFNTPGTGTWVCPTGVTSIKVEAWGGGGGGGYAITTNKGAGGGGGGGAYTYSTNIAVTPGTTYYYRIGTGGTGGNTAGTAATAGQSSCFSTAANCGGTILTSANGGGAGGGVNSNAAGTAGAGGSGGTFSSGGSFTGGAGAAGVNGGAAGGGGGGGGGAGTTANGGTSSGLTGGTGATLYGGNGGDGVNGSSGGNGLAIGGGGAGGHRQGSNVAGGSGANGQIIITYPGYCAIATTSSSYWISNFSTTGGFTNINNATTYSTGGYGNYTSQTVSQIAGGSFDFNTTTSSGTHGINIWVDWNRDLDFADAGEKVYASGSYVSSASGTISIPGAAAVGNYRMRVVANYLATDPSSCGTTTYTEGEDYTIQVNTPPTCYVPTGLTASATSTTTGTASWTAPTLGTAPVGYQYVISTSNATPGGGGTPIATTSVNFSGLTPNTVYYVFIRTNCGAGDYSSWISTSFFTGYCSSTSTSSSYYINDFSTTGGTANITNNASGYSASGYGNFNAQVVSQQPYGTVNFSSAFTGGTFGYNIWVDWNGDLDFNDAGELVYSSGSYVSSATGTITVPGTAAAGTYRMRMVANYNSTSPTACGSISSGETEDYSFTVLASTCAGIPTAVTVGPIAATTATVNWTASSPAPASGYQYYLTTSATLPTGATAPTGSTAAGVTTLNLTGLTANTTYYIYIRNNCGAGNVSPWTSQVSFYTGYCVSNSSSSTYFINNFSTTAGTANITNNASGYSAGGYGNFTAKIVSQSAGGSVNFSIAMNSTYTFGVNIWVDWNDDMDFNDAGEKVYASGSYVNTATGTITVPGSAPAGNHRMRVVANYSSTDPSACGTISSGETEDYTFNVVALPCSTFVTNITANITTITTATVSWTAPASAPASGYQYYLSTSSTTPAAATAPTGSTGAGVTSVNLTGLTSGTTYHIWVRTNCGGGLGQGAWVGPTDFYMPNCAIGNSTGTTTLGCPSVLAGGLGLNGADPAAITCASGGCVDLEATYLQLGNTTSYTVSSIPYNPPYQFGCLKNPVSVNVDDQWSSAISLPFNFCFYGSTYNQCVIGSNGVLTFDMTKAGTSSGYSFSNSLPSTTGALFANTIYGVYHDIDPAKGGEVGWELITLNTGCRALVASWNNVPMFSDNTILYTGMMVLYENTNIIEVYIKNKQIDGTWNGGNAIVGVEDATGSQATVAPGRNGLDTDWTATNEAWRFTPSGTSITSLKWYEGAGTSGPVLGTTPTINVCPSASTTYTAEVSYTLCNGTQLVVTDQTLVTVSANKTWNGTTSTNWGTASNWTPSGVPVSTEAVVIPSTTNKPLVTGGLSAQACSLTIQSGAYVTVDPSNTLTVTNGVSIAAGGDMILEDTGSLVQVNNTTNSGIAHIKRTSKPMYKLDYSYWNTPVTLASAFTAGNLTSGTGNIYRYTPTQAGGNGIWTQVAAGTSMDPTFGIIARAPSTFPSSGAKQTYTTIFTGTPNNGVITMPISKGTNANIGSTTPSGGSTAVVDADDEWNLIGNPYPSAVDIVSFLNDAANTPVVDGTVYLWTHNTAPSAATVDPFYGNYVQNYTINDYATVNSLGTTTTAPSGGTAPTRYIASGQSFFVSAANAMANGTTQNVTFKNAMRVANNNANFLRQSNTASHGNLEANGFSSQRVWLNLSNNNGGFSQILVGYAEGASLGWDRSFDGEALAGNAVKFYSFGADKKLTIQGRFWPFNQEDLVPLGFKATAQGNYTIGIDHLDEAFNNQNIYLEDKLLNVIHDLKSTQYSFTSEAGDFDERFVLRYTNNTLNNNDVTALDNSVIIFSNDRLNIKSTQLPIKEVIVYDVLGKLLLKNTKVGANEFMAATLQRTQSTLLVKVTLDNGAIVTKKVIF